MNTRKKVIAYYLEAWNRKTYPVISLRSIIFHVRAFEKINLKNWTYKCKY
jgi:hypothetical protein